MRPEQLADDLRHAADHDGWVSAIADRFAAAGLFFGHGTDNPSDEAFWLLRHLHGYDDAVWNARPDTALIEPAVHLAAARIRERKPLAYLLGEAWFAGLPFHVNEHVLVPRSPLAEVIERGFSPWAEVRPGDAVLDIGTGSGCLAVAAAVHLPDATVDATDVSPEALAIAARNVARHGVAERVRLHRADLFPPSGDRYRVIMTNPPYVPRPVYDALPPEFAHEPRLGLVGGETGLEPVERLLEAAVRYLAEDGVLIGEVGAEADALAAAHPKLPLTWVELERGGEGVFVVTAEQLARYYGG